MNRFLIATVILNLVSCLGRARADDPPAPTAPPDVVKGITSREMGGHMKFLASDLMRGRDTASPETRLVSEYIASRLFAAGAAPAGESDFSGKTYFQRFPLEVVTPQLEGTSVSLSIEQNGSKRVVPCALGVDVSFFPYGLTAEEIDAPVVFACYGQVNAADDVEVVEALHRLVEQMKKNGLGGEAVAKIRFNISGGVVQGVAGAENVQSGPSNGWITAPLSTPLLLDGFWTMISAVSGLDAGDSWQAPFMTVREWCGVGET